MTSNQLGASTILQPLPNSLGKNKCKFDFLSYFVLLLLLTFQFNLIYHQVLGFVYCFWAFVDCVCNDANNGVVRPVQFRWR
jgi:hypothetical protein